MCHVGVFTLLLRWKPYVYLYTFHDVVAVPKQTELQFHTHIYGTLMIGCFPLIWNDDVNVCTIESYYVHLLAKQHPTNATKAKPINNYYFFTHTLKYRIGRDMVYEKVNSYRA